MLSLNTVEAIKYNSFRNGKENKMGSKNKERINILRNMMIKQEIDLVIVYTADEHGSEYIDEHYKLREYLSGFTGSAGTLVVTGKEAVLWTDGRYFIQAQEELKGSGIELYKDGLPHVPKVLEYVRSFVKKRKSTRIGADLKLISMKVKHELDGLKELGVEVVDVDLSASVWKDRPEETRNPIYYLPDEISGYTVSDKLAQIRKRLEERNMDAIFLTDLSDIMWTFNVRGSDIRYSPVAVSYGYVDVDSAFLFADMRCCDNALRDELKRQGVTLREYDDTDDYIRWLKGRRIVCDYTSLNAHMAEMLSGNELTDERSYIYIRKHIKNKTECELAKDCHIEDGLALTKFIYRIKKLVREGAEEGRGINEFEAAMMLDNMRLSIKGNRGLSFETISAYGSNGAIVHYSPDKRNSAMLKAEGFLLVDSGGQYEGATTDVTRTIALGKITGEMKLDYTAVLKGMLDLSDAVFLEGTRGENLDILARRPIWERYKDYRHGTGHGVGAMLNVHEGPQAFRYRILKDYPQPPLEAGMITSDEPGIYLEGKYGIRIENLLLCTERKSNEWGRFLGFDTLTLVPYETDAIVPEMLTARQKQLINEYHRTIYYLYSPRMEREEREWLSAVTAGI
jgi:Xaa-Pro aminopeptidase